METAHQTQTSQILFAGDAMLGRGVNQVMRKLGTAYPLDPLVEITRRADLFFVNLECAISAQDRRYSGPPKAFYFRADPPAVEALLHAGVDLVSLANNHALDADSQGLLDTLAILRAHGIAAVGAGKNRADAGQPAFIEIQGHVPGRGQRLGILAYCDHQDDFAAQPGRPGIHFVDLSNPTAVRIVLSEVAALASKVDHVIVAFHWMRNWVDAIPPAYRTLGRNLVDAGARVVWGHSPHHFLGVEWMGSSVILYSTGGLVDDYALEPEFRNDRELLFQVSLSGQGVEQVLAYPIELGFARTTPAGAEARAWITRRFSAMCAAVGSRTETRDGWIQVLPDLPAPA